MILNSVCALVFYSACKKLFLTNVCMENLKLPPKNLQAKRLRYQRPKERGAAQKPDSGVYLLFMCSPQSGKFAGASADGQDTPGQGLDYAEDAAEHEQMTAVLRNSLQLGDTTPSVLPGLRTRTRASRGAFSLLHVHSPAMEQIHYLGSHILNENMLSVFIQAVWDCGPLPVKTRLIAWKTQQMRSWSV